MALTIHITVESDEARTIASVLQLSGFTRPGDTSDVHITEADDWSAHVNGCPGDGSCCGRPA